MTPGARVAAAIEILHDMNDGLAAEQALTRWARRSRFAGSKDRAAIRDHVFDVLRCRATAAHYGKAPTPRALLLGNLYAQGADLEAFFSGDGHAPPPLNEDERTFPAAPTDKVTCWNLPQWLCDAFEDALGERAAAAAMAIQTRAPVFLRVNTAKSNMSAVQQMLREAGVEAVKNDRCETALTITDGARKLRNSPAYLEGFVELQDASSQAVVAALPPGGRVLDYCAGGGGKALALAMDGSRQVFAHDIDPRRMSDVPARAARAGASIQLLDTDDLQAHGDFDVVLCDAPCSGSGAWRRSPEGKWNLTAIRLQELQDIQDSILDAAAKLTADGGTLAYATCSVLTAENEDRIAAFLTRHQGWRQTHVQRFDIDAQGDGFFTAHLQRDK